MKKHDITFTAQLCVSFKVYLTMICNCRDYLTLNDKLQNYYRQSIEKDEGEKYKIVYLSYFTLLHQLLRLFGIE